MKKLDTVSWIGIAACVLFIGFFIGMQSKDAKERAAEFEKNKAAKLEEEAEKKSNGSNNESAVTPQTEATPAPVTPEQAAKKAILKTDKFELNFTNRGAGIDFAKLLEHNRSLEDDGTYVTVNGSRKNPIGAFSSEPKKVDSSFWEIKEATDKSVTFYKTTEDKLYIEKTFSLPEHGRPYEVEMKLSIRNDSGGSLNLSDTKTQYIYAGGEEPLHWKEWSMQMGLFYRYGRFYKAKNVDYFGRKKKIMGIFGRSERAYIEFPGKDKEPLQNLSFAGVNNQYFASLIQAQQPQSGYIWSSKYDAVLDGDEEKSRTQNIRGVELAMGLPHNLTFAAGEQKTLGYDLYIGPKEAELLAGSETGKENEWKKVLNYDQIPIFGKIFGWAIKPLAGGLAWCLRGIEGVVGNWGVAIILLTIFVRLLMWPVYAKSARSMKRMSKLSPKMQELKEKYPDDPQKVQQETMKLYSKYGVNPVGGCLPMFLQLPVFLGFYRMLWGAVELRHETALGFVKDLTMPDELFMMGSFPLNILPILMSVASFVQMAMTPKTGDNTQRMIFMLMPVIFLVFCYSFASGLALYWTVSNCFTLVQTWVMNKLPEPELKESTKSKNKKPGFMSKLQDKIEEAQRIAEEQKAGGAPAKKKQSGGGGPSSKKKKQQAATPQPGQSRTKLPSERGSRHTKAKKKKRK